MRFTATSRIAGIVVTVLIAAGVGIGASDVTAHSHRAASRHTRIDGQGGGDPVFPVNTTTTGGSSSAITWAESFEDGGASASQAAAYSGWCAAFVANAYGSEDAGADSAWDLAQSLTLNDPGSASAAPVGSLMFFGPNSYNEEDGHVGISLGGGQMISANVPSADIPGVVLNYPTPNVQSSSYWSDLYRGWAWPPAHWGPLAAQAAAGNNSQPASSNVGASNGSTSNNGGLQVVTQPNSSGTGTNLQPAGNPQSAGSGGDLQAGANLQNAGNGNQVQNAPTQTGGGNGGGAPASVGPTTTSGTTAPTAPASTPATYTEISGGPAHTWSDPNDAGGNEGPEVGNQQSVQVACVVTGFAVSDGNRSWYRLSGAPWNGAFYVSADSFYNGAQPGGSLQGTPFVDPNVPSC